MTPRSTRTIPGDRAVALQRRDAAVAYLQSAQDLVDLGRDANSIVSLYVLAGIAAADAVCCARRSHVTEAESAARKLVEAARLV